MPHWGSLWSPSGSQSGIISLDYSGLLSETVSAHISSQRRCQSTPQKPCDLWPEIEFPEQLGQCGKSVDSGRCWSLPLTNLQTHIVMRLRVVLSMWQSVWPLLSWRTVWSPWEDWIKLCLTHGKRRRAIKIQPSRTAPAVAIKCFRNKSNKTLLSWNSAVPII